MTSSTSTLPQPNRAVRRGAMVLAIALMAASVAVFTLSPGAGAAGVWHLTDRSHRIALDIDPGSVARGEMSVTTDIDFDTAFSTTGSPGSVLDPDSIQVVEVDAGGALLDLSVPFQYDPFDLGDPGTGELTVVLTGSTSAGTVRHYQVYFSATGGSFTAPSFTDRVTVQTGLTDEGLAVDKITNATAEWYYDTTGGGFSSVVDGSAADWVGWSTASRGAGEFRGLPNAVYPAQVFHPGGGLMSSTVSNVGPLRITIDASSTDGKWGGRWSFYENRVELELTTADGAYWFQYEGVPGGSFDGSTDSIVRSDSTATAADTAWSGDLSSPEWVYATDATAGGSLFIGLRTPDSLDDGYSPFEGAMTVMALGRVPLGTTPLLSGTRTLVAGLTTETAYGPNAAVIDALVSPMATTLAAGEAQSPPHDHHHDHYHYDHHHHPEHDHQLHDNHLHHYDHLHHDNYRSRPRSGGVGIPDLHLGRRCHRPGRHHRPGRPGPGYGTRGGRRVHHLGERLLDGSLRRHRGDFRRRRFPRRRLDAATGRSGRGNGRHPLGLGVLAAGGRRGNLQLRRRRVPRKHRGDGAQRPGGRHGRHTLGLGILAGGIRRGDLQLR